MGGIWVDYELMTLYPGLCSPSVNANFSDHGANRLGASALMQGLADGYFVLPYTIQNYLADQITGSALLYRPAGVRCGRKGSAGQDRLDDRSRQAVRQSVDSIHKELGHVMWDYRRYGPYSTAEGPESRH